MIAITTNNSMRVNAVDSRLDPVFIAFAAKLERVAVVCQTFIELFLTAVKGAVDKVVAQVSNRFPTCCIAALPACGIDPAQRGLTTFCRLEIGDTAGWKPALRGRSLSMAPHRRQAPFCRGYFLSWGEFGENIFKSIPWELTLPDQKLR